MKRTLAIALTSGLLLSAGISNGASAFTPTSFDEARPPVVLVDAKVVAKKPFKTLFGKRAYPTSDGKVFLKKSDRKKYLVAKNGKSHAKGFKKKALKHDTKKLHLAKISKVEDRIYGLEAERAKLQKRISYKKSIGLPAFKSRKQLARVDYDLKLAYDELAYLKTLG
ncbi:MAG: hypothetical protein AAGE80_11835 [Pseudomonadota bacterium]